MLIVDASAMLTLCFEDENEQYAEKLLHYFVTGSARAPGIWPLEMCNALISAIIRGRLTKAEANHFFHLFSSLPIEIEQSHAALTNYVSIFELAHL